MNADQLSTSPMIYNDVDEWNEQYSEDNAQGDDFKATNRPFQDVSLAT